MFLEDFKVGDEFTSPGITLTESQIIDFALQFDPQPFHVDVTAATAGIFGGLIASGLHTPALTFRLFLQTGVLGDASPRSPGPHQLRGLKPVRPGGTLPLLAPGLGTPPSTSQ